MLVRRSLKRVLHLWTYETQSTMTIRYIFAVLHLIALSIGIAAVYGRWRALRKVKSTADLGAVFHADNWYGVAAILWVVTGLLRAYGGLEKGSAYYLENH